MDELNPKSMAIGDLILGTGTPYIISNILEEGKGEIRSGDRPRPTEDGIAFGRDRISGTLISFEISINAPSEDEAQLAAEHLFAQWDAMVTRAQPGFVVPMRIRRFNGPTRVVYGRPRRLTPTNQQFLHAGRIDFVLDFRCVDNRYYSAEEFSNSVTLIPPPSGFIKTPFKVPISTSGSAFVQSAVSIGGFDETWIVSEIHGPITNLSVWAPGYWEVQVVRTLAFDETLRIDPRPWSRGLFLNDSPVATGMLSLGSPRLKDIKLPPGGHNIILKGTDVTGTAMMTNYWQNSFRTL